MSALVLQYIDKNGIRLYGVVVTGPFKELLKLKDQSDIAYMGIAQVELWKWDRTIIL
ncbi:anti sigma factor C-terminal domain-containing protein [Paenibacillus pini]|uniref:Sigma factor regulator C-terminal domain-containing protein n=1 Tax=Paenibacillus pini JCM 16418 TaxID=1236976 RepID=W7YTV3_9BACL|nr:anti sigma factor C-terminal domain-containing protein [Paenibacillus pini]GAF08046.1 hypothetical protein JCM16418_2083 [Paenibacillus pini JCM 16418]